MPNLEVNYVQQIGDDELDNNGVEHWANLIHQSRNTTVIEKNLREKRLTSEQFLQRQQTLKRDVTTMIKEKNVMKELARSQKVQNSALNISTDNASVFSEESE